MSVTRDMTRDELVAAYGEDVADIVFRLRALYHLMEMPVLKDAVQLILSMARRGKE